MENEPNPENLKPLKDECLHCEKEYYLTARNATLHMFLHDPVCNYLETTCDHCGEQTHIFLSGDQTAKECDARGIPIEVERYAPTAMRQTYMELAEIPSIEEQAISNRQERRIQFLAYILDHHLLPDDFDGNGELFI